MSLTRYQQQFAHLNVKRTQSRVSPHKMCMLLALIELIGDGQYKDNRIGNPPKK